MQIRCYRCGWSFAIKREEAAFALQALEETGGSHYDSNCPRCRHSNRVSLEQLRKGVPRSVAEPDASPADGDGQAAELPDFSDEQASEPSEAESAPQESDVDSEEPEPAE